MRTHSERNHRRRGRALLFGVGGCAAVMDVVTYRTPRLLASDLVLLHLLDLGRPDGEVGQGGMLARLRRA